MTKYYHHNQYHYLYYYEFVNYYYYGFFGEGIVGEFKRRRLAMMVPRVPGTESIR